MIRALIFGCALTILGADTPADDLATYESAKEAAGRDPDAHVRLALWCEARGLSGLRGQHLRTALEIKPGHPAARGLLGQMNDEGEWRSPAEAIGRAKGRADRADALGRYDLRREQISDTAQAHWQLAQWCEQAGLKEESEAHLRAVVRLDPSREEAWKKLGCRKQGGRWVDPEQIAAEKADADARRKAEARWRPLLAKWKTWLGQPSRSAEAEAALDGVTDPSAVASIWKVFGSGGPEEQGRAVRLLGQVDSPVASRALASLAVFGSSEVVRRSAAETLGGRDPRECSAWLIALLRDPIKFEVRPVGGPGSPGELYVHGQRANTRRFYAAPPMLADLRPGDAFGVDENGFLVARRAVGYTHQPLAAALDPLYSGAPDLTGLGAKLDQAGLGQAGEKLGQQAFQGQQTNANLMSQMSRSSPRASAGGSFNAPVEADIPIGQLMMQAEMQAESSRQNLQRDVAILDRYNADVETLNVRVSRALKVATGEDRGVGRDAWRKWWVSLEETATIAPPRTRAMDRDEPKPPAPSDSKARMPSFGAGTPVWTRAGLRPIEDIRAGDMILTQDPASGSLAFAPVLMTRRVDAGLVRSIRAGETSIVATDFERFWLAGKGWVMAGDFKPGDAIRAVGGSARVVALEDAPARPVFHVRVADRRGIFVGPLGLLAHDDRVNSPVPAPFDAPAAAPIPTNRAARPD